MKSLAKIVASLGFISLVIGASAMDSESILLPIILCFSGLLMAGAGAYLTDMFWEWEEI